MRKRLVWQFSFISAAYFAALAGGSYLTTYLKDYFGFSGTEIGTLVAIGSALAVVFSPIFGAISDKIGSSRKVFIAGGFGCGLLYLILPILGWSGVKTIGPFCLVVPLVYLLSLIHI